MTEETENLILKHLRHIRVAVDRVNEHLDILTQRTGRLEIETAALHGDFASLSTRIDRLENRLDRIEKRLGLVDA